MINSNDIGGQAPRLRSGQVLLESIIALTILSTATLAVFGILSSSIGSSRSATNQEIAAGLAAEGIEVIKELINRNILLTPAGGFGTGLTGCSSPCRVQYNSTSVIPGSPTAKLQVDTTGNGFYNYGTGTDSPFSRAITITQLDGISDSTSPGDGRQLKVVSKVTWFERGGSQVAVELEDRFFDW